MEGHLTTLAVGPVGTAFASLAELSGSLKSLSISISDPKPLRVYGGTVDKATAAGRQKREITVEAQLKESATTVAEFDIFNVTGGLPTDRRWRVTIDGSGDNNMTIDFRVRYTAFNVDPDVDGERLFHVTGYAVYDATLTSDIQVILKNDVTSIP